MVIGAIISGLVGQELVSETSKSIFHSITNILSHEHPVINSILSSSNLGSNSFGNSCIIAPFIILGSKSIFSELFPSVKFVFKSVSNK